MIIEITHDDWSNLHDIESDLTLAGERADESESMQASKESGTRCLYARGLTEPGRSMCRAMHPGCGMRRIFGPSFTILDENGTGIKLSQMRAFVE